MMVTRCLENDGHALLRGAMLSQNQCCSRVDRVMITCGSGDDHMVIKRRRSIIFSDKLIVRR